MWRKCQLKRKILVERADMVTWRSRYLKEIEEYWDIGHLMFYTHKTWTDNNLTFCKCWQEGEVMGIHTHWNSGNGLTMLHVGGIGGFLPPFISHLQGWTWSRRLPWTNEWNKFGEVGSQEKLISNFPLQPVIVLDHSPYQWLQVDRPLSTCLVKTGIIWLFRKGIVSDETMSKNDLPVNSSTEAQRDINKMDRILANHGYGVRLPPFVWPKLIEFTWA